MKLQAIRIFVDDLPAARRFYHQTLGLPIRWEEEGVAIGFDVGGDLILEPVGADADAEDRALMGRFVGCSLAVDDIDGFYSRLKAKGVRFTQPPELQPWGGTLAHFQDPSGNTLTLLQY